MTSPVRSLEAFDDTFPRKGFLDAPTPITALPRLAADLGLRHLAIKRDDLCGSLFGGTKPRKLDYLLAAPPFSEAEAWVGSGGIGSGNMVALTAAGKALGRAVHAHLFWTPVSAGILDNLAFTASGTASISFYASRAEIGLKQPRLMLSRAPFVGGMPALPPGSSTPLGMLGLVRAALELRAQIDAGEIEAPLRIYVPLGSGGLASGLSVGLGFARIPARVIGVTVVERFIAPARRFRGMQRSLVDLLEAHGMGPVPEPAELVLDRGHVGRGYGIPTPASLAACELLAAEGMTLDPVYTGKAMAALLADAARERGGSVLLWQTARRAPLPHDEGWREKLPPALARRIEDPATVDRARRRTVVALGVAAGAAVLGVRMFGGYPGRASFQGAVLSAREAHIVEAAAEALLPIHPGSSETDGNVGGDVASVPARVDRYLTGMPEGTVREVHAMLLLIEQGTTPLGGRLRRFTSLSPAEREAYLGGLAARGGLLAQAYQGLRDLVMVGVYQQRSTWAALGYGGPQVPEGYDPQGPERRDFPAYDALVAPRGARPKGAQG
ncbi:1-aminocyclopropane-1-carboxylate deaminase/D-cysteine desulfhydrase [Chondromyces apiculatus]|uniref:Tryptophan synthase beta chain-like PALP domain-containing protein n=1 Tax=Chondromyces apiculatus DSM 436 TaxID=1192034 RepID=A0A017T3D8_9BACT|nr:pyridoxal-phosphate dependent enzyme [Chondromyces apiculatus]EYF03365.1 Hypothetical protein CAP_5697 [Chondromyces apiculatus DSM 436]